MTEEYRVLWLRPSTGTNVSTRRSRIAEHLERWGVHVDLVTVGMREIPTAISRVLSGDYDVVIGNVRLPMYVSFPAAKLRRVPFIGDVSDPLRQISDLPPPLYELLKRYEWMVLRHSDARFFAHTESYDSAKELGINGVLVPNAVNFDSFSEPSHESVSFAERRLSEADIDRARPIAVYIGRFSKWYHMEEILEAAEIAEEWEFLFIGESGKQATVESAARRLSNVYYLGSFDYEKMPGFLSLADVGLCLADRERPLKILEYGAAGLPVLAIPGRLQTEFSDEELWFTEPTPSGIADALTEISRSSAEAERRTGALMDVARDNSWESVADAYYRAVRRVISR